jgi:PAS domain S-box-containing protein
MAQSDSLKSTLSAVRDLMIQRLEKQPADPEMERDIQMALEELEVMWEELEGQSELLERESARYQEFFEFAPDAYLVTDAGCNVREANAAALELLGAAKAQLIGGPLTRFVAQADREPFVSRFLSVAMEPGMKSVTWTCSLQPARGQALSVTVSVRAIPLRKSGIAGLCWLVRPA